METNIRNRSIDVLKGIGIILVVFNHVSWGKGVFTYIQSFHMPLFFVLSGYLWKHKQAKYVLRKRIQTLLVPYFFFMILFLVIEVCLHLKSFMRIDIFRSLIAIVFFPTENASMPIASAMWFLPCLFVTNIIYALLDRFGLQMKTLIILFIAICGAVYSSLFDYMLPLTLEPVAAALLFMLVGEYINIYRIQESICSNKYIIICLLVIEAVLAFVNGSVDFRSARFHNIPLFFTNGFLGTIIYWGVSNWIVDFRSILGRVISDELTKFGSYSIVVLCTHQFFIFIMNDCLKSIPSGVLYELCGKMFTFMVTILLCRTIIIFCGIYKPLRRFFGML